MKLEVPRGKWFNKTGKTIESKPSKAKSDSQKTTKVSFQSKEDSSDESGEESHTQVCWSWHQESK